MYLRVGSKYRIRRKIGSGGFGEVYIGIVSGGEVAIKLESTTAKHHQLEHETDVYRLLAGSVGIPMVHWFGTQCGYNAMVMDLLGLSLENLFNFCNWKFSLKTVLLIADQLISRTEHVHTESFIHRDLKPENFLMGVKRHGNLVNLVDFGLARRYRDPKTYQHIPYIQNRQFAGTVRYASVYAHLGSKQSRRDDMESLAYILVYLYRGALPWQGLKAATKQQKRGLVLRKKLGTSTEALCRRLPNGFLEYLNYTRCLRFHDKPDYNYLRRIFRALFVRESFQYDHVFDWTVAKYQKNPCLITNAGNQKHDQDDDHQALAHHYLHCH
ncbi:kinase-like domain-containing protein [Aspergillus caelatus]|uniref:non-specific serine/threonine protein kinase n=1 Tax=Aspergillus caelatus TaxID=61420 RepID=A0A5N7AK72_9EURO|nr:kinase-like domain-containing protein [Aspergillus caelatus]KAE8370241.1 kinase-like domain-containing protein [Aspergillus caelatus]